MCGTINKPLSNMSRRHKLMKLYETMAILAGLYGAVFMYVCMYV